MRQCLRTLLSKMDDRHELIIVDQSDDAATNHVINNFHDYRIIYIRDGTRGKAKALNRGILSAKKPILAFTDDDCIVNSGWLEEIEHAFHHNPNVTAVFGHTKPYQPHRHRSHICPATFSKTIPAIITKPCYHADHIGFGNNMAVRASVLRNLGEFMEWLGPGSIGSNAEDAELALRLLIKHHRILYNPRMVVYHNRWLTQEQMGHQQLSYTCGEMACYGYFHFLGYNFATRIMNKNIRDTVRKIKALGKRTLRGSWSRSLVTDARQVLLELLSRCRGIIVGFVYAHLRPVK